MQNITLQSLAEKYQNESVLLEIAQYVCTHAHSMAPLPDLQCAEFPIEHSIPVQIFVATAFTLLILCAIIGNSVVMWIIIYSKVMRRSFNFFLFNMAFADFLMALLNAGSTWSFNFYYDWWFGDFCAINHFFGVAPTCVSVFTMMVVSWDRCAAVVNPLRKRQLSARSTFLMILAIWLLATLLSLPGSIPARIDKQYFYSIPKEQLNERRICHNDFEHKLLYDNVLFTIQFVTPIIVLSYTYGRIVFTFRQNSFFSNPNLTKAPQHMKAKRQVIKMLGLIVVIFLVCWAPYQLYHLFLERLLTNFLVASYTYMVFYWMAMSACVYNPIIYCYFNMRFRTGFRYAFRWVPCVHFDRNEQEHNELFVNGHATRPVTSTTVLRPDMQNYRQNKTIQNARKVPEGFEIDNDAACLTYRKSEITRNNSSGRSLFSSNQQLCILECSDNARK